MCGERNFGPKKDEFTEEQQITQFGTSQTVLSFHTLIVIKSWHCDGYCMLHELE
jgi:hypothetical protein